jgi:hypothetical protein
MGTKETAESPATSVEVKGGNSVSLVSYQLAVEVIAEGVGRRNCHIDDKGDKATCSPAPGFI